MLTAHLNLCYNQAVFNLKGTKMSGMTWTVTCGKFRKTFQDFQSAKAEAEKESWLQDRAAEIKTNKGNVKRVRVRQPMQA